MLVITGPMRSGTSACAALAVNSGIVMGITMLMPLPGVSSVEWEDAPLATWLVQEIEKGETPRDERVRIMTEYIEERAEHFGRAKGVSKRAVGWGVKTPLIAPFWYEWNEAACIAGHSVNTVVMQRDRALADGSVRRLGGDSALAIQERIWSGLVAVEPDLTIDTAALRGHPERFMAKLRELGRE